MKPAFFSNSACFGWFVVKFSAWLEMPESKKKIKKKMLINIISWKSQLLFLWFYSLNHESAGIKCFQITPKSSMRLLVSICAHNRLDVSSFLKILEILHSIGGMNRLESLKLHQKPVIFVAFTLINKVKPKMAFFFIEGLSNSNFQITHYKIIGYFLTFEWSKSWLNVLICKQNVC